MTDQPLSGAFRADGTHVLPMRVYYEDTDAAGIVYYANYLKFAERGRTEMMRLFGVDHQTYLRDHGVAFAVRRCLADYRRPARLDDAIDVTTRLVGLGGATMEIEQAVELDGEPLVTLHMKLACMTADGRPTRVPAVLRAGLTEFLHSRRPPAVAAAHR